MLNFGPVLPISAEAAKFNAAAPIFKRPYAQQISA
jgi:hypothetical protein